MLRPPHEAWNCAGHLGWNKNVSTLNSLLSPDINRESRVIDFQGFCFSTSRWCECHIVKRLEKRLNKPVKKLILDCISYVWHMSSSNIIKTIPIFNSAAKVILLKYECNQRLHSKCVSMFLNYGHILYLFLFKHWMFQAQWTPQASYWLSISLHMLFPLSYFLRLWGCRSSAISSVTPSLIFLHRFSNSFLEFSIALWNAAHSDMAL